jgi:enoyl-CoA hydratase/carnithine racemase
LLSVDTNGHVGRITLARPAKRNALSDELVAALHSAFITLPDHVRVVILAAEGDHFCAGLDLNELKERSVAEGILHSRRWHAAFEQIQFGSVPVVAVLHGAVVGGGLELASACHLRIAEESTFYGLPEGQRGLFLGGGGAARITRLMGVARVTDMMLTGRVYDAQDGLTAGLSQYVVPNGEGLAKAQALAERIAGNAPLSNYAVMQALPRIADQSQSDGLFTESLMAAIAQGDDGAKDRLQAFLQGRADKVRKS